MTEILNQGKFDRIVELIVQTKSDVPAQDDPERQSHNITNLKIDFRIQKFPGPVDNRGTIRVYNLRSTLRKLLSKRRIDFAAPPFTTIFLKAGHVRGGGAKTILRGVVIKGESSRIGADWITEIEVMTSQQQVAAAFCNPESTFLSTPPKVIVDNLFGQLNYGTPLYSVDVLQIFVNAQPVNFAFTGRVDRAIARILRRYDLTYTLDDTGPFVVETKGAINPEIPLRAIPLVSPETGLVGTPKITDRGVELRTILNGELRIFHRFNLRSDTTDESLDLQDRQFTVIKLEHVGTNRGEDFFTNVEGTFFPRGDGAKIGSPESPASFTVEPEQVGG